MNYSVTVLLQNCRRQRVPVKLNTPILVILEEVCKKHDLQAYDYDLKYHQRILDTTSTVQFCGITNNAQLELVPATKSRTESEVTIFLQLESGERLFGSFFPSATLWDVISKLCSEDVKSRENPVIIYTRQEVSGNKLNETTLKMFGLTGGNALLRLIHRSEEQLRNQSSSCTYNLPSKPKKEEPEKRRLKEGCLKDFEKKSSKVEVKRLEYENEASRFVEQNPTDTSYINRPRPSTSAADLSTEVSPIFSKRETEKINLNDSPMCKVEQRIAPFNLNEVKFIGDRYALVFRTDNIQSPRFEDQSDDFYELTVEDAKTLLRDIRRTRSQLEDSQLETAEIKARKKSQMLERTISVYPHCVVRVLFPNRLALQGVFKSTEIILNVIEFVKNYLDNSDLEFYLYLIPPKTIVDTNKSLIDVGGVPGINFHFGGRYVDENPNGPFLQQKVIKELTYAETAFRVANHFRQRPTAISSPIISNLNTTSLPIQTRNQRNDSSTSPAKSHQVGNNDSKSTSSSSSSGRMPKWFKPL